jgi:hypothetical protein
MKVAAPPLHAHVSTWGGELIEKKGGKVGRLDEVGVARVPEIGIFDAVTDK